MNNSNSQLIHAAVELVVGACITFWLNRKISTVSKKVGLLEDKLKFFENMLTQHHELIKKLFSIIENGSIPITKPQTTSLPLQMNSFTNSAPPEVSPAPDKEEAPSSTAALDAILSSEIKDLQIDRTVTLT